MCSYLPEGKVFYQPYGKISGDDNGNGLVDDHDNVAESNRHSNLGPGGSKGYYDPSIQLSLS